MVVLGELWREMKWRCLQQVEVVRMTGVVEMVPLRLVVFEFAVKFVVVEFDWVGWYHALEGKWEG